MKKELLLTTEHKGVQFLSQSDPELATLITLLGDFTINLRTDRFGSLVKSIIGQQISVKAAATIHSRLEALLSNKVSPASIEDVDNTQLREIGLSMQKISYIRDLCEKVHTKQVDLDAVDSLEDQEIVTSLTAVKGIGKWTAEMFLIFSLGRENVSASDDAGLQRACMWLYQVDKSENKKKVLAEKMKKWAPYCSIASLYLWEGINRGYVDSFLNLDEVLLAVKNGRQ